MKYDATSGNLTDEAGNKAGHLQKTGYILVTFQGRSHPAHRVGWFLHHGEWPHSHLDHINGVKSDNRLCNLRLCERSQNQANRTKTSANTSGLKGAYWHKKDKRWWSKIQVNGVATYLGQFDTPEEANAAYMVAATEAFGEFARG